MSSNRGNLFCVLLFSLVVAGCAFEGELAKKVLISNGDVRAQTQKTSPSPLLDSAGLPKSKAEILASPDFLDRKAAEQRARPVLRFATAPRLGSRTAPVSFDDQLPPIFRESYNIGLTENGGPIGLDRAASIITKITNVQIRISPDVLTVSTVSLGATSTPNAMQVLSRAGGPLPLPTVQGSVAGVMPLTTPLPTGAIAASSQGSGMPKVYVASSGPMALGNLINSVADQLGLSWEFRDGVITLQRFTTEQYEIAGFPGATAFDFSMSSNSAGQAGGAGGSSSSNAGFNVTEKSGDLATLKSVADAVQSMIATVPGSSVVSAQSGRLMVRTSKEVQSRVREFVRAENASLLKQASIQFDIYSYEDKDADAAAVDWSLLFGSTRAGFSLSSPASVAPVSSGQVGVSVVSGLFSGSSMMLSLLSERGTNAKHRVVSLLTLNRQAARRGSLDTQGYISETTPAAASSAGSGTPGLKTDKITTGEQFVAYPQILDNNIILLKFGINLSDLLVLDDQTVGTGASQQKVQTPRISSASDQGPIRLEPGQTAVITGLSRLTSTNTTRSLSEQTPIALGGSRSAGFSRQHFLILVRPVVL